MNWLYVMVGAAAGAPLRYLTDRAIQRRHKSVFPAGTLAVNVVASLVLGLITGAASAGVASSSVRLLLGTGLCATLSTYSTFSFETLRLGQQGSPRWAGLNVALSIVVGVGAAFVGVACGQLL